MAHQLYETAWANSTELTPAPEALQSGDFLWPKVPGQYVPYRSGATTDFLEDRAAWLEQRAACLRTDASARWLETLEFRDFYEQYMTGESLGPPLDYVADIARLYVGHVGIVLVSDNVPHVVEALFDRGVTMKTYADWLAGRSNAIVWQARLRDFSPEDRRRVAEMAHTQIRKPFAFFNFELTDTRGFYCSKLCWFSAFNSLRLALDGDPNPTRSFWYSPKQMMTSESIEIIFSPGEYSSRDGPSNTESDVSVLTYASTDPTPRFLVAGKPMAGVDGIRFLVAEPVTFTVVMLWLAEGAVAYVGGQLIAAILGRPSIRNVKKWIAEAVRELKRFITQELHKQLDQQYLEELGDQLDGVRLDLIDYDAVRTESLLTDSLQRMNGLIPGLRDGLLPAIALFANVVSLRLLVLTALIQNHSRQNYATLIPGTIQVATEHIESAILKHVDYLDAGVASVSAVQFERISVGTGLSGPTLRLHLARFNFRGGQLRDQDPSEQRLRARISQKRAQKIMAFEEEKREAIEQLHDPLREVIRRWQEAAPSLGVSAIASGN